MRMVKNLIVWHLYSQARRAVNIGIVHGEIDLVESDIKQWDFFLLRGAESFSSLCSSYIFSQKTSFTALLILILYSKPL